MEITVSPVLDLQAVHLDTTINVRKFACLIMTLTPLLPMFFHPSLHSIQTKIRPLNDIKSPRLSGKQMGLDLFKISGKSHPGLSLSLHPFLDPRWFDLFPLQLRYTLVNFLLCE